MSTQKASVVTIKVSEPCRCVGKRWFDCDCGAHLIAEYEFDQGGIDGGPVPNQDQIAYVRALHPDATLIHLD